MDTVISIPDDWRKSSNPPVDQASSNEILGTLLDGLNIDPVSVQRAILCIPKYDVSEQIAHWQKTNDQTLKLCVNYLNALQKQAQINELAELFAKIHMHMIQGSSEYNGNPRQIKPQVGGNTLSTLEAGLIVYTLQHFSNPEIAHS